MFLLYCFFMGNFNIFINKNADKNSDMNIISDTIINETPNPNPNPINKKINNGCDERYNESDIDFEKLYNIQKSFKKIALLKTLESPTISIIEKLDKINYYSFLFNETMKSKMGISTREGGLYNDWDFEI